MTDTDKQAAWERYWERPDQQASWTAREAFEAGYDAGRASRDELLATAREIVLSYLHWPTVPAEVPIDFVKAMSAFISAVDNATAPPPQESA